MAIYVVSDIHGYYDLFLSGLSEIAFSKDDYLWCLGDAIDRGADGIRILQYIMSHDNMDLIIGNHELMMLNSVNTQGKDICDGKETYLWLEINGGRSTFDQYRKISVTERITMLDWLKSRYVIKTAYINGHPYCLTHSFYNPQCENMRYKELSYDAVWNITWSSIWREDSFTHAMDIYHQYDYTFICGHVPIQHIAEGKEHLECHNSLKSYQKGNLINIDGGCAIRSKSVPKGAIFLKLDDMLEHVVMKK